LSCYNTEAMFLTQEQREARRAQSAARDTVRIVDKAPGRPVGATEVPAATKTLVGTLANLEGQSNIELARDFDLSPNQVSAFKQGKTTVNGDVNPKLREEIDKNLGVVKDHAENILLATLGLITPERLAGVQKVKELTVIAKDMSTIVRNVTPQNQQGPQNLIQIINHGQNTEAAYETIEVQS
jgi:hypothetical protein